MSNTIRPSTRLAETLRLLAGGLGGPPAGFANLADLRETEAPALIGQGLLLDLGDETKAALRLTDLGVEVLDAYLAAEGTVINTVRHAPHTVPSPFIDRDPMTLCSGCGIPNMRRWESCSFHFLHWPQLDLPLGGPDDELEKVTTAVLRMFNDACIPPDEAVLDRMVRQLGAPRALAAWDVVESVWANEQLDRDAVDAASEAMDDLGRAIEHRSMYLFGEVNNATQLMVLQNGDATLRHLYLARDQVAAALARFDEDAL